ncbi:VOC family protein [Streptosporangium sp. NBC_01756]|uniref:VOC family protein n=1 Tax=Streptosporangium sp. NBC_01756 TaxID=2975950 RepID=UPI003FA391B5
MSPHLLAERPGGPLLPTCTANRCAYFGQSFIELLGVVDPAAPDPWGVHQLRETYRGLLMTLGSSDIQATAHRLRTAGLASTGIRALEREVPTPEGPRTDRPAIRARRPAARTHPARPAPAGRPHHRRDRPGRRAQAHRTNEIPTHATPDGFYVAAQDACGVPLAFTQS